MVQKNEDRRLISVHAADGSHAGLCAGTVHTHKEHPSLVVLVLITPTFERYGTRRVFDKTVVP